MVINNQKRFLIGEKIANFGTVDRFNYSIGH